MSADFGSYIQKLKHKRVKTQMKVEKQNTILTPKKEKTNFLSKGILEEIKLPIIKDLNVLKSKRQSQTSSIETIKLRFLNTEFRRIFPVQYRDVNKHIRKCHTKSSQQV